MSADKPSVRVGEGPQGEISSLGSALQENVKNTTYEILGTRVLFDIQPETLQFLRGSQSIKGAGDIMKMLYNIGRILKIQRFLLYRMKDETQAEILLIFSTDENEMESVGQSVSIEENPNLRLAVEQKQLSQIPVPGMGIDAAFPVGQTNIRERLLIVGVDNSDSAREFSDDDMAILTPAALMLATAYNAGYAVQSSGRDKLTGLANRGALDTAIDDGVDIFNMPIGPIDTVAFFDVDKFKNFNTKYGHATGDAVLRHMAQTLDKVVRAIGGSTFRYGGEEFVALLPNLISNTEIDTIRKVVGSTPCEYEGKIHTIRCSIGYMTRKSEIDGARRLIRLANEALLDAKETGRNRTCEWKPREKLWIKRIYKVCINYFERLISFIAVGEK